MDIFAGASLWTFLREVDIFAGASFPRLLIGGYLAPGKEKSIDFYYSSATRRFGILSKIIGDLLTRVDIKVSSGT